MDSSDLKPEQGERLTWQVRARFLFVDALVRRMEAKGFPKTDPLMVAAIQAHRALVKLYYEATSPCGKSATCRAHKWMRDRRL